MLMSVNELGFGRNSVWLKNDLGSMPGCCSVNALLPKPNQLPTPKGESEKAKQAPLDPDTFGFSWNLPLLNFLKAASRGILDIQSVEAKRKKKEQLEKQMDTPGPPAGGLRVSGTWQFMH